MKRKILSRIFYTFLGVLLLSSCEEEASLLKDESVKDIAGTWKIVSLTRNGEDLTQRIDLSKFRLVFNADGTYAMQDKMAFVTDKPGTYKLGDPQYPFSLVLTPQGQEETKIKFQFPVIEGKRQLSLTLSPGCASNTYQYNFARENEE